MPSVMRALSLWRPWPALINVRHPQAKRVENRGWGTNYRGEFAVHAAKKWDPNARDLVARLGLPDDLISWNPADHPTGVTSVATLIDVFDPDQFSCACDGWAVPDQFHWRLGYDVEVLPEVVECPGRQGWWGLPSDVEATVRTLVYGSVA